MIGAAAKVLLGNPYVVGGIALALVASHGYVYYEGRSTGGAREALRCEARVAKLQGKYDEQAKTIEALNKQHRDALDAFVESEAGRAKVRQEELDEANAKNDEYIAKLADSKKACVLDSSDVGVGVQQPAKR